MTTTWTRGDPEPGAVAEKVETKPAVPPKLMQAARKRWDEFEGSLRKSLEKAIALGKALLALKEECPHGEFGRQFSDHKEKVDGYLPFTSSWARKLMAMSQNEVVANREHVNDLPSDLAVIYELATMTAPALEAAIAEGKVTPQTTREEAKAIKREAEPAAPRREKAPPSEVDVESQLTDLFTTFRLRMTKFVGEHSDSRGIRALARSLVKTLSKALEE